MTGCLTTIIISIFFLWIFATNPDLISSFVRLMIDVINLIRQLIGQLFL